MRVLMTHKYVCVCVCDCKRYSALKREDHLSSCPNPVTADRSWHVGVCSKTDVCEALRSATRQGGVTLLLSEEAPIAADWLASVSAAAPAVADPARLQLTCLGTSVSINEIPIVALLRVHYCVSIELLQVPEVRCIFAILRIWSVFTGHDIREDSDLNASQAAISAQCR